MKVLGFCFALFLTLYISSCCKGPYEVAGVELRYPNLTEEAQLRVVRTQQGNLQHVIDTVDYCRLNSVNHFACILEFEEPFVDYIIFVEGSNYVDTLTNVFFERKNNCREDLKEFKYELNGQPRITPKLSFTN